MSCTCLHSPICLQIPQFRYVCMQDLDACFALPSEGAVPSDATVGRICGAVMAFVQARNAEEPPHQPERAALSNGGGHAKQQGGHGAIEERTQGGDAHVEEASEALAEHQMQPVGTSNADCEEEAGKEPGVPEYEALVAEVLGKPQNG